MKTQMPIGVDDAGTKLPICKDTVMQEAYRAIGFDFYSWHIWGSTELDEYKIMRDWADHEETGLLVNQEGGPRPAADAKIYDHPGHFYQPDKQIVRALCQSKKFLGFTYDEAEHWQMNGVNVTSGPQPFVSHFADTQNLNLEDAHKAVQNNLKKLMSRCFPGFARNAFNTNKLPVVMLENVFPVMMHMFAKAGFGMSMKLLKESVTPVQLGMALGACAQYHVPLWPCIDMWGLGGYQVQHKPTDVLSALRMSFYTGSQRCYIENFNYEDSLYSSSNGHAVLNEYAEAIRKFRSEELPELKRSWQPHDFRPTIAIIRYEDSDWGQMPAKGWILGTLFGSNVMPDDDTRYWHRIWSLIMHQKTAPVGVNFNQRLGGVTPMNIFFPSNNAGVFDHTVTNAELFSRTKLVFLTGKHISAGTMRMLHGLVKDGVTVVTTSRLAPHGMTLKKNQVFSELKSGDGSWIVCDDVLNTEAAVRLAPMLGSANEFRLGFHNHTVTFRQPNIHQALSVKVS